MQSIGFLFGQHVAAGVVELYGGQRHCAVSVGRVAENRERRLQLRSSAFTHSIGAGSIAAAGRWLPSKRPRWPGRGQFNCKRDRVLVGVAGYCAFEGRACGTPMGLYHPRHAHLEGIPRLLGRSTTGGESPVKDHQARTVPIPMTVSDELLWVKPIMQAPRSQCEPLMS